MSYLRKCLVELRNTSIDSFDQLAPAELKAGDAANGSRIDIFGTVSPLNVPKGAVAPGNDRNNAPVEDAWS
jgi:hypothetical protein